MPTFAHTETGQALTVKIDSDIEVYTHRFNPDVSANMKIVEVPDGTLDGAKDNGDGTYTNPVPPEAPTPQPNTPNNPYFPGFVPKSPDAFWGLVQTVFIAMQGSNAAGADRFARLVNSSRASGVVKIIGAVDLINPDDKQGAFLRELSFLTTTAHETDSAVLMTADEVTAIMQPANWK